MISSVGTWRCNLNVAVLYDVYFPSFLSSFLFVYLVMLLISWREQPLAQRMNLTCCSSEPWLDSCSLNAGVVCLREFCPGNCHLRHSEGIIGTSFPVPWRTLLLGCLEPRWLKKSEGNCPMQSYCKYIIEICVSILFSLYWD